jgi:hypothetical protein
MIRIIANLEYAAKGPKAANAVGAFSLFGVVLGLASRE